MEQIWNEDDERLSRFAFEMWRFTVKPIASRIMDYVRVTVWAHQPEVGMQYLIQTK